MHPWTGTAKPSGLSLSGSVSLSHSPLHPHFSGCLGKSTIPAALLNNASVFKVPLLTTSLCQKQHACCVCLWKPPALGDMCTHSAVVSIYLHLFLCHSHCCVQQFVLLLYKKAYIIILFFKKEETKELKQRSALFLSSTSYFCPLLCELKTHK